MYPAIGELRRWSMPALEQYANVDVQVGPRLFEQVPQQMRTDLWASLVRRSAAGQDCVMRYPALQAQNVDKKTCGEIEKDVPRTFPDVPGFNDPLGQRRLVRILRSYSLLDPEVGYCQGMNFVAGLILKYLKSEAEAFGAFCVLMGDRNYRELFLPHMRFLHLRMSQLEQATPPEIAARLRDCQITAALYAPQWFLSCFANEMPTTFSARIIDALLQAPPDVTASEVLMKVALRVLIKLQPRICGGSASSGENFEFVLKSVRQVPKSWGAAELRALLSAAFLDSLPFRITRELVPPPPLQHMTTPSAASATTTARSPVQQRSHSMGNAAAALAPGRSFSQRGAKQAAAAATTTTPYSLLDSDVMERLLGSKK
mmetsp:Transcript_12190/g.25990  ORF Transcript_12190/g.25990 Transcript_12190/m.25990 type:complete len:372 (+) Transcript_12190:190-1305(+)